MRLQVVYGSVLILSFVCAMANQPQAQTPTGALPDLTGETLEVPIGPSKKEPDPVAIPDLRCNAAGELCAMAADVLRNDLLISGFFKILKPQSFIGDAQAEPLESPKWADWFNVNAKYLIKGELSSAEGGGLNLEFRLFNVFDKQMLTVKAQSAKGIAKDAVRGRVHEFANAVIEAITGKPGVFGTQIVYSAKTGEWTRSVFVMDMDGHNAGAVISNDRVNALPSKAMGGILYTSQADNEDPQIWLGNRKLTDGPNKFRGADMGPSGTIAVSVDTGSGSDIWLMNNSGKLIRNLTGGQGDNVSPRWSPDGSMIAFVSNRSGGPQIYVMNSDGSGQRRLTMAGSYNSTPDFGPDGLIVFAGLDEGTSDIFTVDLSGNIQRLTQGQGTNKDPTWSPDGRWIAFVSSREGGRIFIMTADGRYQFPLSQRPCSCATPRWGN